MFPIKDISWFDDYLKLFESMIVFSLCLFLNSKILLGYLQQKTFEMQELHAWIKCILEIVSKSTTQDIEIAKIISKYISHIMLYSLKNDQFFSQLFPVNTHEYEKRLWYVI